MSDTCDACGLEIDGPATYSFDESGELEKVTHQTQKCERWKRSADGPRRSAPAIDVGELFGGGG